MAKKQLLSKLNKKDYNNLLEKVLEEKEFTANTKNLLLSMLYKIETSYKDYKKVKVLAKSKEDFIEEIISTINDRCNKINLVEPNSEKGKELEKKQKNVIVENDTITSYPTENALITAIAVSIQKNFNIRPEYRIISTPLKDVLKTGYISHIIEPVYNFDGWAWNIQFEDEKEMLYSLIFFNIINLLDLTFIGEWKDNEENTENYIDIAEVKLMLNYGKNGLDSLIRAFYIVLLKILIIEYKEETVELLEEGKNISLALEYLENKSKYLEDIYKKKKIINNELREIDNMLLDKRNLAAEYERRNKDLPLDQQIFSTRHLAQTLKQEREILFNQIKNYNIKLEPNTYIKEKEELKEKYVKFKNLEKIQKSKFSLKRNIIYLQKIFLKAMTKKIETANTKKELVELIYILRYYKFMKISKTEYLKTEAYLQKSLENFENALLERAYNSNVFIKVTDDSLQSAKIISKILDTKIINLESIELVPKVINKKITLEIYDGEILDSTLELPKEIKQVSSRKNKKIKLFN